MSKQLLSHLTLAALLAAGPAFAQLTPQGEAKQAAQAAPAPAAEGGKTFSQQDLDTILAPIALYPDALLAQILMAATYPLEIVEADRWVKANPKVKDQALQDAMEKQAWDPSVKALTAVPQVLDQMSQKLDWTQKLGDAFLADQKDIMATVQGLRAKAAAAGNLKSSPEVAVKTEQVESKTVYVIESSKPEVVYVPTYNPATIYGSWWYSYPPYSMYPPAYVYPPYAGLHFAAGVVVGAAIWGNMNWGGNNVNINVNKYNNFNKANLQNNNFNHNAANRKGVAYKDQGVANKYNRGASAQNSQARSQFQGRDGGGGGGARADNYGGGGNRGSASASQRGGGASQMGSGSRGSASQMSSRGGGGGGFQGAGGGGASTRAASSRGSMSRGGGGGGGGRRR
jgi:hypothetical protein